jgi:hypothetical protein
MLMSIHKTEPPWEFLLSASRTSLQSYELSRLSHAANLRKEIGQLLDSWLDENAAAMLARWLMEQRERPRVQEAPQSGEPKSVHPPNDSRAVSHNVFGDQGIPPRVTRGPL